MSLLLPMFLGLYICVCVCWSQQWAVLKQLNQSRCRLGCGLRLTHGTMCLVGAWIPPGDGALLAESPSPLWTHTHTRPFYGPFSGTTRVKPIWILLKQETVSGSGISWDICKSATRSRQITMPAPHRSVFYRPDALPAAQPTASKHWRHFPVHCEV